MSFLPRSIHSVRDRPWTKGDAVEESEFVYRRIHRVYFDPAAPVPIRLAAFRPTQNDSTGISVFRAGFVQPPDILGTDDRAKAHYVARLAVRDLRMLGLTVAPDPLPGGPRGHAIVPELSSPAYQADKARWKPVLEELAKLASAAIVLGPTL